MPSLSAAVRAKSFPFHLRPPILRNNKKDPSQFLRRSVIRAADAGIRRIAASNSTLTFAMHPGRVGRNGAARSKSASWWAGTRSSLAGFSVGERRCVDGGVAEEEKRKGGEYMDSLHHHHHHRHQNGFDGMEKEMDVLCKNLSQQQQQHGVSCSRLLTLPTVLTIGRVAAVPLLVTAFHMSGSWAATTTTGIFLVAAATDWLDGYLARKMRLGTAFGAFLDPVADKLMVAATLVLLCSKPFEVAIFGVVPWILTVPSIAIIGREITMSAVREWAASQSSAVLEAVAVNNLGKWKTATQMAALTILLYSRDPSLSGTGFLISSGVFLLYVSAGLALWSLAVYMRKTWRFMIK